MARSRRRVRSIPTCFSDLWAWKAGAFISGSLSWPEHLHGKRRFVLDRFPFSIIYLDADEGVSIVAVAHRKRNPDIGSKGYRVIHFTTLSVIDDGNSFE